MRKKSILASACTVVAIGVWLGAGCGGNPVGFGADGSGDGTNSDASADDNPFAFGDVNSEAPPACVNLECNVQNCGGGAHTTISGIAFDPAGRNPLYNVYVYVPNAPVQPITTGAICEQCQAPASGSPLPGAVQTDATGKFVVTDAPVGNNIPLVMQIGKFRRQIIVPTVNACVDNPLGAKDSNGLETITRLARKQNEGSNNVDNVPQLGMATGGCDVLECLMRKIGIDDSEFTKTGRVHLFQGQGGVSGPGDAKYTDAYQFWADQTDLLTHDIIVNSCECSPYDRNSSGPAYTSMHNYLDGGGRLFGTHYHYNWFAPPTGPTDFQGTAKWLTNNPFANAPWYINTTIPKGVAFNAWIQNVWKAAPPTNGQINLVYSNSDASQVLGKTTPWIYYGNASLSSNAYGTAYLSFDTPITVVPPNPQCGRAVFSDLHVSSGSFGGTAFPQECGTGNPLTTAMTQQESALEFLFFDLSSCVTDDTKPPPPPPPN
jgi:hypothetical protein